MKNIAKKSTALIRLNNRAARLRRAKGASSVEYIIVLIFIAVAGIMLFQKFGSEFKSAISTANTSFTQVKP